MKKTYNCTLKISWMWFLNMLPGFSNSKYNALWSFLNKEKETDYEDMTGLKYKLELLPFRELIEKTYQLLTC